MTSGVTAVPGIIPGAVALPMMGGTASTPSTPSKASSSPAVLGSSSTATTAPAADLGSLLKGRVPLIIGWFLFLGIVAGFRPQWAIGLTILSILAVLEYMQHTGTGVFWGGK